MAYQVKFTETTNPAKPSITVEEQTLTTQTSVTFVGKNYAGYAPVMAENFLHLLENFASPATQEPNNPVQGQLWYDNTNNLLKVYDGTTWTAAGSVKKSGTQPTIAALGDLWVDTNNSQLYVYSGSNWLLVGPQFSAGLKTGPDIETITDTNNVDHNVISFWSENYRLAIISKAAFTPKQTLSGFTVIGQGLNLSTVDSTSTTAPTKIWGTAEKSNALVVNGTTVDAANFLRSDQSSTSNYPINIRNNGGITVGSDLSFNITTDVGTTIFYSRNSGNGVDFKVNSSGVPTTVLHLDATARVGIGSNNTNPQEALDVAGNILSSGKVIVTDSTDATVLGGEASITTSGGLNVDLQSKFGGDVNTYGKIYVNNLDINDNPQGGSVILPGYITSSPNAPLYDIGDATHKFRNVYAESFVGNFTGTLTTTSTINGSVSGSAGKLASPTVFSISGDVSSTNTITFDGQGDSPAVFTTVLSSDVVHNKTEVTESVLTDELLIYRTNVGLRKTTKQTFISTIPTVPVAAIFPYAGSTPPSGYLLCDGSEVKILDYPDLFQVIGYTYKSPAALIGSSTFALPDLRGRFPLGRDNMDNGKTVPDKNDPTILRDAGGGSANRVTDVVADTLGAGAGFEARTIATTNLPDHRHTLATSQGDYFAVGRPGAVTDSNGISPPGPGTSSAGLSVPNTGGILGSSTGTALPTMNPYLTINYIIFTGTI
jgi:microcystin-dependent protein